MIAYKYGITLERLTENDLELVRKWRNSDQIRQFMEYREEITPEMQKKWFESINNFNNFYFLIIYQNQKIGLINTSKIDWETISSEGGIFLWEEKYYETFVPVWASLLLLETNFYVFNATRSFIKTLRDNERAKKLNVHLGYELLPNQDNIENQEYTLIKEIFETKSKKLIKAATLLAETDSEEHYIFFSMHDMESGLADFLEGKMNKERINEVKETAEGKYLYFC